MMRLWRTLTNNNNSSRYDHLPTTATSASSSRPPLPSAQAASSVRISARTPLHQPVDDRTQQFVRSDRREAAAYRSATRRAVQCFAWPLFVVAALFVVLIVLLQWPVVHRRLMRSMRVIHTEDGWGMPMDYDRISGVFPWRFTIHGMRVVDPTGRGFSAGEAQVRTSLWRQITTRSACVESVIVRNSVGVQGDGYIEDNTHLTTVEHTATDEWAARNAREKTWPVLPYGLVIEHLVCEGVYIPALNRTIYAQGNVSFNADGGNFAIHFSVSDSENNTLEMKMDATKSTRRVRIQVQMSNTTELCRVRPQLCEQTVDVRALFPDAVQPLMNVASALDLSVDVSGSYGGLLQTAFPSKHHASATDLIAGTVGVRVLHPHALISSVVSVFRFSGNRTVHIEEARLETTLLPGKMPFIVAASVDVSPHQALPQLLHFAIPRQRVTLPLPIGEAEVEFHLGGGDAATTTVTPLVWQGNISLSKYERSIQQWQFNSNYTASVSFGEGAPLRADLQLSDVNVTAALGQMQGDGSVHYTHGQGVEASIALLDSEHELQVQLAVSPYTLDDRITHRVSMLMQEHAVELRKLRVEQLRLSALVHDVPYAPHGVLEFGFAQVNYDNGVFVMNNGSVAATKAEAGPLDTTPWELTASSDSDLRTRFTLMLVGNGADEFHGSVAPFEATLYGQHRVWTTDATRVSFNYRRQTFTLACLLHANVDEPTRASLDVNLDNDKLRLMFNDASYLLDPLLFEPRLQTDGLLQGYIEVKDPLHAPYMGAVDLCLNDGIVYDAHGTLTLAHSIHGCVRGNEQTGWHINSPPALFVLESPRLGECEMRANVSATIRPSGGVVDFPVEAELRMRDPDASQWFEGGWLAVKAQLSMKL